MGIYVTFSVLTFNCHTHTDHKEPHDRVVTKECYVPSYDELTLFTTAHVDFLLLLFDPIEDPLKFHGVIPPSHTVVTPVNVNNVPRGGIPTNLCNNDTCQKHTSIE